MYLHTLQAELLVKFSPPLCTKLPSYLRGMTPRILALDLSCSNFALSGKQVSWEEAHLDHVFMPLLATIRKKLPC